VARAGIEDVTSNRAKLVSVLPYAVAPISTSATVGAASMGVVTDHRESSGFGQQLRSIAHNFRSYNEIFCVT
jgi:hypothetical protein